MAEIGYRVQATIPTDAAVGADTVTNVFHFRKVSGTEAAAVDQMFDVIQTFYSDLATAVLSAQLDHNLLRLKAYDLEDPEPRTPVLDEFRAFTAPTVGSSLPHENAIVLSIRAAFASGVNPARRRGRLYIGPLQRVVIEDSGSRVQVTSAARSAVATAADNMMTTLQGVALSRWAVFSPTTFATSGIGPALNDVIEGFVDNEMDIQRRRGQAASARTTVTP